MIIDCISDLHGNFPKKLEGGDLLLIAGDLTAADTKDEYISFIEWCMDQKYDYIVAIAGNHDNWMQKHMDINRQLAGFDYLCDSGTEFQGLKIWGSPWTCTFEGMNPKCMAFTVDTDEQMAKKLEKIPEDTDILITHSPPFGILDQAINADYLQSVGSPYLYSWLKFVGRPKLHVFGHIHEAYGKEEHFTGCISVNASHVDENYRPSNKPVRIIL